MALSQELKNTVFKAVVEAYKLHDTNPEVTTFEQLAALFEEDPPASPFSLSIQNQKYAHQLPAGGQEDWRQIATRVVTNVMASVNASQDVIDRIIAIIVAKKFIAGGRYLYATGRPFHQTQNCLLLRAEDSREGWAELLYKSTMALMTGAGIGVVYSDVRKRGSIIKRTGGVATGPCSLACIVNEDGRNVMQGGARRSAIWAGLHWWHGDIFEFIKLKNWSPEIAALKAKDFNFPAPFDMTNISVILDDEFFDAIEDESHPRHELAHSVYWTVVEQMLRTGEPGFSIDVKENAGENLRNAPVTAETRALTLEGYKPVSEIVDRPATIWTGYRWADDVVFHQTDDDAEIVKVTMTGGRSIRCDRSHPFIVERHRGAGDRRRLVATERIAAEDLQVGDAIAVSLPHVAIEKPILPGPAQYTSAYTLGYIYGDGSFGSAGNAEITFCTDESKRCADVIRRDHRISSVTEQDARGYIRAYFRVDQSLARRKKSEFPTDVYALNGLGEQVSFIAGLFDADGNWDASQKRVRLASIHEPFLQGTARLLEQLGIVAGVSKNGSSTYGQKPVYQLVIMADYVQRFAEIIPTQRLKIDVDGYAPYRESTIKVLSVEEDGREAVYCADVSLPEHSFVAEGVMISNCTEISSRDDSDICNLGSINLARITSLTEMREVTELATIFLLAGTCYSDVPYGKVHDVRSKNRRLGLGLMGIHEFLLLNGRRYGPDPMLTEYLEVWRDTSDVTAAIYSNAWGISRPIKVRAIAPNGTIGIIAMTTTSGEPIFCVAYKRRYLKGSIWVYQYVVDPTALRLVLMGHDPDSIEDAYDLASDVERRVAFQAYLQKYVDHAISSTINLPAWGTEYNNSGTVRQFGQMLLRHLPNLRGITCYPDGARGGQPLTPVKLKTALSHIGRVFVEGVDDEPAIAPPQTVINDEPYALTLLKSIAEGVKKNGAAYEITEFDLSDSEVMTQQVDVCDISGKGGTCAS